MYTFLIILILVAVVLLILVVLAQKSKGGGLSSAMGGSGASNQLIGVKKTGDLLERFTWGLMIAIVVLTISTNFVVPDSATEDIDITDKNVERAKENLAPLQQPQNQNLTPSDEGAGQSVPGDIEDAGEDIFDEPTDENQ